MSSHGACRLVGHVVYGACRLGAFRLGAYCLEACRLGACRLTTVIQEGDTPIGKVRGAQRPDWVLQSPSTTQGAKVTAMEQTYQPGEKEAPGTTQVPVLGAPVEKGELKTPLPLNLSPLVPLPQT